MHTVIFKQEINHKQCTTLCTFCSLCREPAGRVLFCARHWSRHLQEGCHACKYLDPDAFADLGLDSDDEQPGDAMPGQDVPLNEATCIMCDGCTALYHPECWSLVYAAYGGGGIAPCCLHLE